LFASTVPLLNFSNNTITGGNGGGGGGSDQGNAGSGGNGGVGLDFTATATFPNPFSNSNVVVGGNGGDGAAVALQSGVNGGNGGAGGVGIEFAIADAGFINASSVDGGNGGSGGRGGENGLAFFFGVGGSGGDGATGVAIAAADVTFTNSGSIAGGKGGGAASSPGPSGNGGDGGAGVIVTATGGTFTNSGSGSVVGGDGGGGGSGADQGGTGGDGGVAVEFLAAGAIFNDSSSDSVRGGAGGAAGFSLIGPGHNGGSGGVGVELAGGTFNNSSSVYGGNGGAGGFGHKPLKQDTSSGGEGGAGGVGAEFTADATFTNSGTGSVHGGNGGAGGGLSGDAKGVAGGGGGGGLGVAFAGAGAFTNSGTGSISGGDGGTGGGGNGSNSSGSGGQGGSGVGFADTATFTNGSSIAGGDGGVGGAGLSGASGATGGGGGDGVFFVAAATLTNESSIVAGKGGDGGSGTTGGNGGGGGSGLAFEGGGTFTNTSTGSVVGGDGGAAGTGGTGVNPGAGGAGVVGSGGLLTIENEGKISGGAAGAGVIGSSLDVINSGEISGGLNNDGVTHADAIDFSGTNTLELDPGPNLEIVGNVVAHSTDTFALGGTGTGTFDVSQIGASAQYQGFGFFQKLGTSTWTLTGTTSAVTPWDIIGGILVISEDENLGDPSGGLAFDGGTLQFSQDLDSARAITLNSNGGTFDTGNNSVDLSGPITGAGGLTKVGAGTLSLGGINTYLGATEVDAGFLAADASGALSPNSAFTVASGAVLDLGLHDQTIGSLAGNGTVHPGSSLPGPVLEVTLTTGADDTSTTFAGVLEDGSSSVVLALAKVGIGTFTLSGANTYSGGTALDNGTLDVAALNAAGTHDITFGAGSEILEIENAALSSNHFGNNIDNFRMGQLIDLTELGFAPGAKASYDATKDILSVTSNGVTDTLTLLDPGFGKFTALSDGSVGTEVELTPMMLNAVSAKGGTLLSGIADAGSTVSVSDGTKLVGTATVASDGTWSLLANVTGNVVHSYTETDRTQGGLQVNSAGVTLYTPAANNALTGGSGDDVLIGQPNDKLTGNGGSDTFVFNPGLGKETITDFDVTQDVIAFAKSLFPTGLSPSQIQPSGNNNSVIVIDAHDAVTLTGVSAAQLLNHIGDIHLF
jgi:hypothetical protein